MWTMTEIDGKAVRPADKLHRKIVLSFDAEAGTFTGTSGCNDLAGHFSLLGDSLTLATGKKMEICRVDQRTERSVKSAITDTRSYRVTANTLELLDEKGQRIAKLQR